MVSSRLLCAIGAVVSFAQLVSADSILLPRAPFDAFGIVKDETVAADDAYAALAPPSAFGSKNATENLLKDRSLDLEERQTCSPGYGYCESFGRCCPTTADCCSYGYCIDPLDTCCPDAPCKAGWGCCGPNCYPKGGDCCIDNNYCEPGNMCVKLGSTGRIVCCTDLECTAAVVSGSTSYISTSTPTQVIESTPISSFVPSSITAAPSVTAAVAEEWYWTVTWWYYSFYWTVIQTSEVTWSTIYETTTFTTTATDRAEASSLFAALSSTLTFPVPSDAQTSLIAYITAAPSLSSEFPVSTGFSFNSNAFNTATSEVVVTVTARKSTSQAIASAASSSATQSTAGGSGAHSAQVHYTVLIGAFMVVPGLLMIWL